MLDLGRKNESTGREELRRKSVMKNKAFCRTRASLCWPFILACLCVGLASVGVFGQHVVPSIEPAGGGSAPMPTDEITQDQRAEIWANIRANIRQLEMEGKIKSASAQVVLFKWPLAKAAGIPEFNIEGISNYVDQNTAFPNQLQDYNCGARTYDQAGGYNHAGIDMFTWPFGWKMMDRNEVFVVAGGPGTIVFKSDGNFDRNCGFGAGNWNAVYIQHADGSIAWYGHMKNGSTIAKSVGETVVPSEILGVVGSSGNSTGPHLHFELRNASNQLQEPYQGTCNLLNNFTWWETQEPYRNTRMNRLMTHSAGPSFPSCPNTEVVNEKNVFRPGESFITAGYFRDALTGNTTQYTLFQPNGAIFTTWNHNSPNTYSASYWFWNWNTTAATPKGRWRLRAVFNGTEYNHFFNFTERAKFDYDGDNKTDLSVFRGIENNWYIFNSSGGITSRGWGVTKDKPVPADFDGDGKTDIAVWRPSEGNWYIVNSTNNTVTVAGWGQLNDQPVPADYNGDSRADLVVYRPSNRNWYRRDSDGLLHVFEWGLANDRPAPADFTGDGRTDMAVFRPDSGTWYVLSSSDAAVTTRAWGLSGDTPIPGDYDGDAKADFCVFRPTENNWYRTHSSDNSIHVITWGLPGDKPTPGDYDGDGKADLAVFRPINGTWYIFGSGAGIWSQQFGVSGDTPTPNALVY